MATAAASPWAKIASQQPVSLAAIQAQEQVESDHAVAVAMQAQLDDPPRQAQVQAASPSASTSSSTSSSCSAAPASPAAVEGQEEIDDETLAILLQAQFDEENDRAVRARERHVNVPNSKISVSLELFRAHPGLHDEYEDPPPENSDEESDTEELTYDKGHRVHRDSSGQIVTKHNLNMSGRQNRRRMMDFPLSFETGDLRTNKSDRKELRIPSKVYNKLQHFSHRAEKQRHRLHETKEFSTNVMALDAKTRLVLFRLVNSGKLEEMNGCVSTGKESVVFQGTAAVDPENPDLGTEECAVKVFKTTLTEFKERQQFLHGDRRFEARVGKQSARKLVKLWAEKESANLIRMRQAGLNCPRVMFLRKHVLGMSFVGSNSCPAPKLKDANFKSAVEVDGAFQQVREAMRTLFNDCDLVHADLSEYNILWFEDKPWIIDVGQSVETAHPRASEFLFRDCLHIHRFFERAGATVITTAGDLFEFVTGVKLPVEEQSEFSRKLRCAKGRDKTDVSRPLEDTSDAVLSSFAALSMETKAMLLEGLTPGDEDDDDEESSSEDDLFGDHAADGAEH